MFLFVSGRSPRPAYCSDRRTFAHLLSLRRCPPAPSPPHHQNPRQLRPKNPRRLLAETVIATVSSPSHQPAPLASWSQTPQPPSRGVSERATATFSSSQRLPSPRPLGGAMLQSAAVFRRLLSHPSCSACLISRFGHLMLQLGFGWVMYNTRFACKVQGEENELADLLM